MRAKKILVVDDDRGVRTFVIHMLEHEGYRVVIAADGEEALEKVETERPDLVVLDIMLPGKNGYQVCRSIKSGSGPHPPPPILMLSAKDQPSDRYWATRVGADGYLTKPFDPSDLLDAVQTLLGATQPAG
jgi:two-component system alkaline phosphatase synthesis response regulator PhoP